MLGKPATPRLLPPVLALAIGSFATAATYPEANTVTIENKRTISVTVSLGGHHSKDPKVLKDSTAKCSFQVSGGGASGETDLKKGPQVISVPAGMTLTVKFENNYHKLVKGFIRDTKTIVDGMAYSLSLADPKPSKDFKWFVVSRPEGGKEAAWSLDDGLMGHQPGWTIKGSTLILNKKALLLQ